MKVSFFVTRSSVINYILLRACTHVPIGVDVKVYCARVRTITRVRIMVYASNTHPRGQYISTRISILLILFFLQRKLELGTLFGGQLFR